ncbi:hypothetical protein HDU77_009575 [Chytriomyces hyalinus]|nr:hypothetical protein HDU77_009575 [Chytriomyces hyalinus]
MQQRQHQQKLRQQQQQQQQQEHPAGQQQPQQFQSLQSKLRELCIKIQTYKDKLSVEVEPSIRDFLEHGLNALCIDQHRITMKLAELSTPSVTPSPTSSSNLEAMMAALQSQHMNEMSALKSEYKSDLASVVADVELKQSKIVSALQSGVVAIKSKHASDVAAMKAEHANDMSTLKSELLAIKSEHASDVAAMKAEHANDMSTLKSELLAIKAELVSAVADRETRCVDGMSALRAEFATFKLERANPDATQQMDQISALRADLTTLKTNVPAMRSEIDSFKSIWSTIREAIAVMPNAMGPVETKETDHLSDDGSDGGSAYLPSVEGSTPRLKANAGTRWKGILKNAHPHSCIHRNLVESKPALFILRAIADCFIAKHGIQSGRIRAIPAHLHEEFVIHFERAVKSFQHENSDLQANINSSFDLDPYKVAESAADRHSGSNRNCQLKRRRDTMEDTDLRTGIFEREDTVDDD